MSEDGIIDDWSRLLWAIPLVEKNCQEQRPIYGGSMGTYGQPKLEIKKFRLPVYSLLRKINF
jgi:hypothetical protein